MFITNFGTKSSKMKAQNPVNFRHFPLTNPRLSSNLSYVNKAVNMECGNLGPPFGSGTIQYITKSLYFMIPCAFPVLRSFQRRRMSLFVANKLKCLSINHLHKITSLSSQALSSLVKPGQGNFLNHRAPPIRHSHTLSFHSCIGISQPKTNPNAESICHYTHPSFQPVSRQGRRTAKRQAAATRRSCQAFKCAQNLTPGCRALT